MKGQRMHTKRVNLIWSVIALIICAILLVVSGALLAFAFMGYENGDYPTFGDHGIYSVRDDGGIIPEGCAVITDRSVTIERGCPVVFIDGEIDSQNRMNVLYFSGIDDENGLIILSDASGDLLKEVPMDDLKGCAVMTLPFVGNALEHMCSLYGICVLLLVVCVLVIFIVLLSRGIVRIKKHERAASSEYEDVEEEMPEHEELYEQAELDGFSESAGYADDIYDVDKYDDGESYHESDAPRADDAYTDGGSAEAYALDEEEDYGVAAYDMDMTPINSDIGYKITAEDAEHTEFTFMGESNTVRKLGKIIRLAALKKNAEYITTEENFDQASTLIVRCGKKDESIITAIIDILKNKEQQ